MSYKRQTPAEPLMEYVDREFTEVERAFALHDFIRLKQMNEPPRRLYSGLVVYADGTNWDPGSGEGIYAYYGGSWSKLG